MLRKIVIIGAALMVTGCYDFRQREYDIQQEQHERALSQIMGIYDMRCSVNRGPAYQTRDDSFCDGLREAYWAIQSDRNLQGFPEYEKLRAAKEAANVR